MTTLSSNTLPHVYSDGLRVAGGLDEYEIPQKTNL